MNKKAPEAKKLVVPGPGSYQEKLNTVRYRTPEWK